MQEDAYYMRLALEEAQKAYDLEEVPIGAVLVDREGRSSRAATTCARSGTMRRHMPR